MYSDEVKSYEFGSFCLNVQDRQLLKNNKSISISHKRFEILLFLVKNQDTPVSKTDLLNRFWDENYVAEFNVSQHIYEIRKLLKKNGGDETYIETVPKYGYRFVANVTTNKTPLEEKADVKAITSNFSTIETKKTSLPKQSLLASLATSKKRFFATAILGVLLLVFVGVYTQYFTIKQTEEKREIKSIAILPFKQIKDDSSEKWGLGIADSLITELSNQKQISISPTVSITRFVDAENLDPIKIGENLGVDAVLIGTIQRNNEIVRINIQCIGVEERTPLWSDKFDANFSDIFSLQDKLSKHIARKFSINFAPEQKPETNGTKNIDAYKAYSMGLFHSNKIFNFSKPSLIDSDEILKTIEHFETAIEKDPQFLRAYIKLAKTYIFMGTHDFSLSMSHKEVFSKARIYAEKALELDSDSPDAYAILGTLKLNEGNLLECRNLLEKAMTLQPNSIEANVSFGWLNAVEGNWDEAISKMRNAHLANPHDQELHFYLIRFFLFARKPNEALAILKKGMEINPPDIRTNFYLAKIAELKGELEEATKELEVVLDKEPENLLALVVLSRLYAKQKQFQKAKTMLSRELKGLEKQFGKDYSDYYVALAHFYLGNKKEALNILSKVRANYIFLIVLKYDYNFDPIRNTKEFKQILSKLEKELITPQRIHLNRNKYR